MGKIVQFNRKIVPMKPTVPTNIMSICDLDATEFKVVDQRDWEVPEFKNKDKKITKKLLCAAFICKNKCEHCLVTRILEEENK
jgi:hypothetical protein